MRGRRDEAESSGIGGGLMRPPPTPPIAPGVGKDVEEEPEMEESDQ